MALNLSFALCTVSAVTPLIGKIVSDQSHWDEVAFVNDLLCIAFSISTTNLRL